MNCQWLLIAFLAVTPMGFVPSPIGAAENPSAGPPVTADGKTFEQRKQEALDWLDNYLRVQVLFEPEDIQAVRETVAQMNPEELEAWIERTSALRADLESPEWKETQAWLREFLRVQAIYTEDEIADFRAKVAKMSPTELRSLLADIEQRRREFSSVQASWQRTRQAAAAAMQPMSRPAPTGTAVSPREPAPTFGQTYVAPARERAYRYSRPLITSLDVAREAVYRSIFPGRYWW